MTDGTTEDNIPEEGQVGTEDSAQQSDASEWESKYKNLQADYTRKAQELAELKRQQENLESKQTAGDITPDEKQLLDWMQSQGFVRNDDLQKAQMQQLQELEFNKMLDRNPELEVYAEAIKNLQRVEGGTFEEVAIKYKFTTKDKLEKAKASRGKMVGNNSKEARQEKSPTEMSSEEYAAWKQKHGIGYSAGLVNSRSKNL